MWQRIAGVLVAIVLAACGQEIPAPAEAMPEQSDLAGTRWQVEDIDAEGVADQTRITIEILQPGQVAGSAGCNRYFGTLQSGGGRFEVSAMGHTGMACVAAVAEQEARYLKALSEAAAYEADSTFLKLRDADGNERIRAVRMPEAGSGPDIDHAGSDEPQAAVVHRFECNNGVTVSIEFSGPETLSIGMPDGDHVLQRVRSASGARYAGDGVVFWNKGDEAMLDIGGVQQHCARSEETGP